MERFCPKCGHKVTATAKFCPHCGYNFALREKRQQTPAPQASREQVKSKKGKSKYLIALLIICIVLGGGYYYWSRSQGQVAGAGSSATQQSSNDSTRSSSSTGSTDNTELASDLGPKGTSAAVTYYAAKNNIDGWNSVTDSDNLQVDLSTDDDLLGSLSATGQGMAYVISDDGKSGNRKLVYTIDEDNTINIYSLPNDYDSDSTYKPVKQVAKSDMVDSINSNHYAGAVKKLQAKVAINQ